MESAPGVTDLEGDVASLGVLRGVAALAVGGLAVVLVVLPAMVGLAWRPVRWPTRPPAWAAWPLRGVG